MLCTNGKWLAPWTLRRSMQPCTIARQHSTIFKFTSIATSNLRFPRQFVKPDREYYWDRYDVDWPYFGWKAVRLGVYKSWLVVLSCYTRPDCQQHYIYISRRLRIPNPKRYFGHWARWVPSLKYQSYRTWQEECVWRSIPSTNLAYGWCSFTYAMCMKSTSYHRYKFSIKTRLIAGFLILGSISTRFG